MPELNEHDLQRLLKAAGHAAPEHDLTARIMAQVAVTPMHRPAPTAPLIGRWGWVAIVTFVALALLGALFATPQGVESGPGLLAPVQEFLGQLRVPGGPWPAWVPGACVVALLLVAMDRVLSRSVGAKAGH